MILTHPYTITYVAKGFMDDVFKLHMFTTTIMSDRDPVFLSQFWQNLFN